MSKDIVSTIDRLAKLQGMSLKEVGKKSGVGENAIFRWNKITPRITTLKKVANFLNIDYKLLLP